MARSLWAPASFWLEIEQSDANPPIIKDRDGRWIDLNPPDFERLLGEYISSEKKIILYKKGINWMADGRS
jgi:hypothetical protein